MTDITIRLAARPDIDALVEMRRDFTFEDPKADEDLSRERAQQAARDERVELMIVWPSDESVELYKREGFADPDDPLIWEA